MKAYLTKHPVTGFIVLTFFISLAVGFPLKLFVLNPVFNNSELGNNYFSRILVVFGPAIAALIVTYFTEGGEGVSALLSKLKPNTTHIIWWMGLPVAGIVITVTCFVAGGFTLEQLVVAMTAVSPFLLLAHFFLALVLIGLGEELGWRGWLLPKLSQGRPIGIATLLVYLTWALWHLPVFFYAYRIAVPFVFILLGVSVLFTWLWFRVDGNLFVMAIAHASIDFPYTFFDERAGKKHVPEVLNSWIALAVIYMLIAAAVYLCNKKWWLADINQKPRPPYSALDEADRSNSFM